jgi:hypothetical protein
VEHPTGPEPVAEAGELLVGRVVRLLGLLLGVEVVQVPEELVEAVHRRQELVAVAEVVLAELARRVALRLQRRRYCRVLGAQSEVGPGEADLRQARAVRVPAGDERRPAGCAALLAVVVREPGTLVRQPIDVRGPVPHHAVAVAAQVRDPYVVAPDDEDVRLVWHVEPRFRSVRGRRPCARTGRSPLPTIGQHGHRDTTPPG